MTAQDWLAVSNAILLVLLTGFGFLAFVKTFNVSKPCSKSTFMCIVAAVFLMLCTFANSIALILVE